MTDPSMCGCGQPLHYSNPETQAHVQELINQFGATTVVTTPDGSWRVPRHFIALHGLFGADVAYLADLYDWEAAS